MTRGEAVKTLPAADHGGAAVLHLQIRLYEGRKHRLFSVMAPVLSAFWDTPYVFVDHPGRPLLRREHCRLCPELPDRRRYWRCRPDIAAPGCRVVCAADGAPDDKGVRPCIMEIWKTAHGLHTIPQHLLQSISEIVTQKN